MRRPREHMSTPLRLPYSAPIKQQVSIVWGEIQPLFWRTPKISDQQRAY